MTRIRSKWVFRSVTLFILAVTQCGASAQQDVFLTPDEYGLWQGDWWGDESGVALLAITDVDTNGFEYSIVERVRPNSPNIVSYEEGRASFLGPLAATSSEGGTLSLTVAVGDRNDRAIVYEGATYQYKRTTFEAGFDCEKATTRIEISICRNALVATGDRHLNNLYRELLNVRSADQAQTLRAEQRSWLAKRNRDCRHGEVISVSCLARLYSDRLVALARLKDPELGTGSLFDSAYVRAMLTRDTDMSRDIATRLAMYPLEMKLSVSQIDGNGVLLSGEYEGPGEETWPPIEIIFPIAGYVYSDMLFIDQAGKLWTASHTEPILLKELQEPVDMSNWQDTPRIWVDAGRSHFFIRSESGFEYELEPSCLTSPVEREHALAAVSDPPPMPELVRIWVDQHSVLSDRQCCCG